jgi:hypothetical protein
VESLRPGGNAAPAGSIKNRNALRQEYTIMLLKNLPRSGRRRGVILMVVFALLTLFAIIGITFVLYAGAEATSARVAREAEDQGKDVLGGADFSKDLYFFLGQLLYDTPDPNPDGAGGVNAGGAYSSMRGNSLSRLLYGYCDVPNVLNDKAFNGTGKLHYASPLTTATALYAKDDAYLINFTYWSADNFLRDPECYPARTGPTVPKIGNTTYTGGFNSPYTYPDHQNTFLATLKSDGTLLMPSFHRYWLFDPNNQGYPANPNWTSTEGKYLTCLVRPADMGTGFPTPDANGLSVKNLPWAPGGNDSGWMDLGAPVQTAPNGQLYKTLYAPFIVELDSHLNLNVIGNILGTGNSHASNQGWGVPEVNLSRLFSSPVGTVPPTEWANLFVGGGGVTGRYGASGNPGGLTVLPGDSARTWAQADFNGIQDPFAPSGSTMPPADPAPRTLTGALTLPTAGSNSLFPIFPVGYGNGVYRETTMDGTAGSAAVHPLVFNALYPQVDNRALPTSLMLPLLSYNPPTNTNALSTDLYKLFPTNLFTDTTPGAALKRRLLITLLSADLERSCTTPYVWDVTDPTSTPTTRYQFNVATNPYNPLGQVIPFPGLTQRGTTPAPPPTPRTEFDVTTWRSVQAALAKVDLTRALTRYPSPDAATGCFDPTAPTTPGNLAQIQHAIADRQQFALDIFNQLRAATGALDVNTAYNAPFGNTSPEYLALRYLAQLAVNIVDFVDYDDYSTPFNWNPLLSDLSGANAATNLRDGWVFGTELPRVVVNEIYAEYANDLNDPGLALATPKANYYNVNLWAELMNPFVTDNVPNKLTASDGVSPLPDQQAILNTGPLGGVVVPNGYTNYQIVLAGYNSVGGGTLDGITGVLRNPGNVIGDPDFGLASGTNVQQYYVVPLTTPAFSIAGTATTDYVTTAQPASPTSPATFNPAIPLSPTFPVPAAANPDYRVVNPLFNAINTTGYSVTPAYNSAGPTGSNVLNGGFYVLGPNTARPAAATVPNLATTSLLQEMKFFYTATNDLGATTPPGATLLVRRLACPGLPPNDPIHPGYNPGGTYNATLPPNPYITMDYASVAGTQVNNNVTTDGNGTAHTPVTTGFTSYGRTQPYAASVGSASNPLWFAQTPTTPVGPTATPLPPKNTFFRQNSVEDPPGPANPAPTTPGQTIKVPFDWLVHLDRQPISPMELLHVSGFKPHELTQMFVQPDGRTPVNPYGVSFQHYAPWLDGNSPAGTSSRLFRFLEMVTARSRAAGMALNGRIPGKINLNNVWDMEVFRALCDAQQANFYYGGSTTPDTMVDAIFAQLLNQRSPGDPANPTNPVPAATRPWAFDKPFRGFSMGPYTAPATPGDNLDPNSVLSTQYGFTSPTPRGINNTLLAVNAAAPAPSLPPQARLFDPFPADTAPSATTPNPPQMNPYQRMQLLSKIYNGTTTKSNVFAVWVTVGYFLLADQTTPVASQPQPLKLGAEMLSAGGTTVRHQLFAIVDRSQMQAFNTVTNAPVSGGVIANVATVGANTQVTSYNHGLQNNMTITMSGVTVAGGVAASVNNTAANPFWTVQVVDANTFALFTSAGTPVALNGAYTGGGTWATNGASTSASLGILPGGSISNVSGNGVSPIQITTAAPHGLAMGTPQVIGIGGVQGNTAANGGWQVTVIDATNFTLNNSTGNGNYTAGTGSWTACANLYTGQNWSLQANMVLTYEPNSGGTITGASNTAGQPITITSPGHGLVAGQLVTISGVQGNNAANNTVANSQWVVAGPPNAPTASTFTLVGSTPSGNYTGGGTWSTNNEETVVVQPDGVQPNGLLGNFRKVHPLGVRINSRGNPGPWSNYDPGKDPIVVPFVSILN